MPLPLSLSSSLSPRLRRFAVAAALACAAASSHAIPVMDMRLEDLMPMAQDFKKELNLNANQQILWQQTENRTRQLLRERQARRERLQASLQQALNTPKLELRDLEAGVAAESGADAAEEKQLREWWLTVNDALDERQRQMVAQFLAGQLTRVSDAGPQHDSERGKGDAGGHGGRKPGGKGGAGGGGGGMGMPGG